MKKTFLILIIPTIFFSLFTQPLFAEVKQEREPFEYKLMVPLPTSNGVVTSTSGIVDYIMTLYYFLFGIAGVLAMGMIIYAGFQWITASSNFTSISQAKSRISNAALGLVILLASYVILNTINPNLTKLKEPYIYFITWDEEFKDNGNTGGGGGGSTVPNWCTDNNINNCGSYQTDILVGGFIKTPIQQCNENACLPSTTCFFSSTGGAPGCQDCSSFGGCGVSVAPSECGFGTGIPVTYCGKSCIYDNDSTSPTFGHCKTQ